MSICGRICAISAIWIVGFDCYYLVIPKRGGNSHDKNILQGFVDYVLIGKDGLPLAVIEAKRTSKDPNIGRKQAVLYADCLERKYGRRPAMFTTNGFETYYWDDKASPQRRVSGVFSKDDLQKLINRRDECRPLNEIPVDDRITDRYYQKEVIRAVCDQIQLPA